MKGALEIRVTQEVNHAHDRRSICLTERIRTLSQGQAHERSHTFDSCRFMLLTYGLKFDGMKASSRLMPPQLKGAGTICDELMKVGNPT